MSSQEELIATLMTILLFILGSFALNMAPGSNNLFSMAHAKRYGVKIASCAGIRLLLARSE